MRILVTGGLGVNGAWVVRELLDRGHEPVSLDSREDLDLVGDIAGDFERRTGDVADLEGVEAILAQASIDRIVHLAIVLPAEPEPFRGYRVNAHGTVTMLEAARRAGIERFVLASSKAVFGDIAPPYGAPTFKPLGEEDLPFSVATKMPAYSAAKIFSEHAAAHYRETFGMSVLALRFATIFGPGKQARHGGIGVVSRIVEAAATGQGISVPDALEAKDDLVYVRDVAASLAGAVTAPEPEHWTFNIGSGRLAAVAEFCEAVRAEVAPVEFTLEPGWDYLGTGPLYALMDIGRAGAELGYVPRYSLREGVRDYAAVLGRSVDA